MDNVRIFSGIECYDQKHNYIMNKSILFLKKLEIESGIYASKQKIFDIFHNLLIVSNQNRKISSNTNVLPPNKRIFITIIPKSIRANILREQNGLFHIPVRYSSSYNPKDNNHYNKIGFTEKRFSLKDGVISFEKGKERNIVICGKLKAIRSPNYHLITPLRPYWPTFAVLKNEFNYNFDPSVIYIAKLNPDFKYYNTHPIAHVIHSYIDDHSISREIKNIMVRLCLEKHIIYEDNPVLENSDSDQIQVKDTDRVNLTDKCVFTIDPENCRDADDAISFESLDSDSFIVGVHISDVSHFVKPDSEADIRAKSLGNTIYVPHKAFHMLPQFLSKDNCSLWPQSDRFAISILFILDSTFEIKNYKIIRSLIRPCAKLSYKQAYQIIQDENESVFIPSFNVENGFTAKDIYKSVKAIYPVAKFLRNYRMCNGDGVLTFDGKTTVRFDIDSESLLPTSIGVEKKNEADSLIEELMLLANRTVAKITFDKYPNNSVLRSHPCFNNHLGPAVDLLAEHGIHVDVSSRSSISQSFQNLSANLDEPINQARHTAAQFVMMGTLDLAKYKFSNSNNENVIQDKSQLSHFALNCDYYTHFTSPIRRYSDILVHRILLSIINNTPLETSTTDIDLIVDSCNITKRRASICSSSLNIYYLWLYIKFNGSLTTHAVIYPSIQKISSRNLVLIPYNLILFDFKDTRFLSFSLLKVTIDIKPSAEHNGQYHKSFIFTSIEQVK